MALRCRILSATPAANSYGLPASKHMCYNVSLHVWEMGLLLLQDNDCGTVSQQNCDTWPWTIPSEAKTRVFFIFLSFIWIRHEVHRNKYKTQKKEQRERQTEKNSYTLKWLNYYIHGSWYQNMKPKVKVMYDSGQLGSPVSNKAEVRLLYLAKTKNRLTHLL